MSKIKQGTIVIVKADPDVHYFNDAQIGIVIGSASYLGGPAFEVFNGEFTQVLFLEHMICLDQLPTEQVQAIVDKEAPYASGVLEEQEDEFYADYPGELGA